MKTFLGPFARILRERGLSLAGPAKLLDDSRFTPQGEGQPNSDTNIKTGVRNRCSLKSITELSLDPAMPEATLILSCTFSYISQYIPLSSLSELN